MPNAFPKVREDLRVSKQKASGQVHYIVGDPVTGKYIRLREPEFFIFQYLAIFIYKNSNITWSRVHPFFEFLLQFIHFFI